MTMDHSSPSSDPRRRGDSRARSTGRRCAPSMAKRDAGDLATLGVLDAVLVAEVGLAVIELVALHVDVRARTGWPPARCRPVLHSPARHGPDDEDDLLLGEERGIDGPVGRVGDHDREVGRAAIDQPAGRDGAIGLRHGGGGRRRSRGGRQARQAWWMPAGAAETAGAAPAGAAEAAGPGGCVATGVGAMVAAASGGADGAVRGDAPGPATPATVAVDIATAWFTEVARCRRRRATARAAPGLGRGSGRNRGPWRVGTILRSFPKWSFCQETGRTSPGVATSITGDR